MKDESSDEYGMNLKKCFLYLSYFILLEPSSKEIDFFKACLYCKQYIPRLRLYKHTKKCMRRHETPASLENSMQSDQENSSQSTSTLHTETAANEAENEVSERSLVDQALNPPFTQEPVLIVNTPRRPHSLNLDPRLRRPRVRVVPNLIDNSGSGQETVDVITINTDDEEMGNNE